MNPLNGFYEIDYLMPFFAPLTSADNQEQRNVSSLMRNDDFTNLANINQGFGNRTGTSRIMETVHNHEFLAKYGLSQTINIIDQVFNNTDNATTMESSQTFNNLTYNSTKDSNITINGEVYSICKNGETTFYNYAYNNNAKAEINFLGNDNKIESSKIDWNTYDSNVSHNNDSVNRCWSNAAEMKNILEPNIETKPLSAIINYTDKLEQNTKLNCHAEASSFNITKNQNNEGNQNKLLSAFSFEDFVKKTSFDSQKIELFDENKKEFDRVIPGLLALSGKAPLPETSPLNIQPHSKPSPSRLLASVGLLPQSGLPSPPPKRTPDLLPAGIPHPPPLNLSPPLCLPRPPQWISSPPPGSPKPELPRPSLPPRSPKPELSRPSPPPGSPKPELLRPPPPPGQPKPALSRPSPPLNSPTLGLPRPPQWIPFPPPGSQKLGLLRPPQWILLHPPGSQTPGLPRPSIWIPLTPPGSSTPGLPRPPRWIPLQPQGSPTPDLPPPLSSLKSLGLPPTTLSSLLPAQLSKPTPSYQLPQGLPPPPGLLPPPGLPPPPGLLPPPGLPPLPGLPPPLSLGLLQPGLPQPRRLLVPLSLPSPKFTENVNQVNLSTTEEFSNHIFTHMQNSINDVGVDFQTFEKFVNGDCNCVTSHSDGLVAGIRCCMWLANLSDNRMHINNNVPGSVFENYNYPINSGILWNLIKGYKTLPKNICYNNSNLIQFSGFDISTAFPQPIFDINSSGYAIRMCFKIEGYSSEDKAAYCPNFQTPITIEDIYDLSKMKTLCKISDFSPVIQNNQIEDEYKDVVKRSKLILWVLNERKIKFQKPFLMAFGLENNNYRLEYNNLAICAVGSGNGVLRFFDNSNNPGPPSFTDIKNVSSFAWCPNSNVIATVTLCGWLQMCHIGSSIVARVIHHTAPLLDVKWNTLGTFVTCLAIDKLLLTVDINGTRCMRFYVNDEVMTLDLNASVLVTGDINGVIQMWKIDEHPVMSTHFNGHIAAVLKVVWDFSGRLVASSSNDLTVRIWQFANPHYLKELQHDAKITDLVWSPKSRINESGNIDDNLPLLLGTADITGNVRIWDVMTANLMWRCLTAHVSIPTYSIAFNHTGEYIAGGSFDQIISEWEVKSGDRVGQTFVKFNVCQIAYVPNEDRYISAVGIKPFQKRK